jgi:tRNA G18 (ribose-2'-O)-methylase SpoU
MRSRDFSDQFSTREIVVIAHNIRSVGNVGAILRSAEGFGVRQVFASGYTPNLEFATDGSGAPLLPHVREKLAREIHKTALGAEQIVDFEFTPNLRGLIEHLRQENYLIVGLEQDENSQVLSEFARNDQSSKIALLLGEEVYGLTREIREMCDVLVEIPMRGRKESFNVAVSCGIALYALVSN